MADSISNTEAGDGIESVPMTDSTSEIALPNTAPDIASDLALNNVTDTAPGIAPDTAPDNMPAVTPGIEWGNVPRGPRGQGRYLQPNQTQNQRNQRLSTRFRGGYSTSYIIGHQTRFPSKPVRSTAWNHVNMMPNTVQNTAPSTTPQTMPPAMPQTTFPSNSQFANILYSQYEYNPYYPSYQHALNTLQTANAQQARRNTGFQAKPQTTANTTLQTTAQITTNTARQPTYHSFPSFSPILPETPPENTFYSFPQLPQEVLQTAPQNRPDTRDDTSSQSTPQTTPATTPLDPATPSLNPAASSFKPATLSFNPGTATFNPYSQQAYNPPNPPEEKPWPNPTAERTAGYWCHKCRVDNFPVDEECIKCGHLGEFCNSCERYQ